jgi:hypothetical protein
VLAIDTKLLDTLCDALGVGRAAVIELERRSLRSARQAKG